MTPTRTPWNVTATRKTANFRLDWREGRGEGPRLGPLVWWRLWLRRQQKPEADGPAWGVSIRKPRS